MSERSSTFASTAGGVITVEVGAVTGDLELLTRPAPHGGLEVKVRYVGAKDWYTVEGSPVSGRNQANDELHKRIIERLTTPGEKEGFNEEPTTLEGFPA